MSTSVDHNSRQAGMIAPVEFMPVKTADQISDVAELATSIWYEYYVPLIGRAQVAYMVTTLQSAGALRKQIDEGYEYFLVRRDGGNLGYLAVQERQPSRQMFISKFYVTREERGAGTGRACMEFIERRARQRGLTRLWLTVNKGNPAVRAYERLGFRIVEAVIIDIGGGFVMDDFRMERDLP